VGSLTTESLQRNALKNRELLPSAAIPSGELNNRKPAAQCAEKPGIAASGSDSQGGCLTKNNPATLCVVSGFFVSSPY